MGKTRAPGSRDATPGPAQWRERERGWMEWRHSRLIQWLVLFAVVHPGQHCPPQTFLLWGHQDRVSVGCSEQNYSQSLCDGPPFIGRAWGNSARLSTVPLLEGGRTAQGRALRQNPDSATGGMTLGSVTLIICTRQIIIPASWGYWEDSAR